MEHPRKTLTYCKYCKWALDRVEKRLTKPTSGVNDGVEGESTADTPPTTNEAKTKVHVVIRRMVPSPSWTPLSNQRLMVSYLSLYIKSPHTQTSIHMG